MVRHVRAQYMNISLVLIGFPGTQQMAARHEAARAELSRRRAAQKLPTLQSEQHSVEIGYTSLVLKWVAVNLLVFQSFLQHSEATEVAEGCRPEGRGPTA